MRHLLACSRRAAVLCSAVFWAATAAAGNFPDAHDDPPKDWDPKEPVFRLSQDYPQQIPVCDYPWLKVDFRADPMKYLKAILDYAYQGNIQVDWYAERNEVRRWYHAPWMHWGLSGREFIHGLTSELPSEPGKLHPNQKRVVQNWAVSLYNEPGGYTIGKVWKNPQRPEASGVRFPEGTLGIKLLFTEANEQDAPFLKNAKVWKAHIHRQIGYPYRAIKEVRLLQIDVAARDPRADDSTGWVFGSFIYNGDAPGETPWDRMVPIGLMWGNDPGATPEAVAAGAKLKETFLNPAVRPLMTHYGWADRLNGPVDNKASSCMSCHGTAQLPVQPLIPPAEANGEQRMRWFRNVRAGEPFDAHSLSLDYSLQLTSGIQNLREWERVVATRRLPPDELPAFENKVNRDPNLPTDRPLVADEPEHKEGTSK